MTGKTDHDTPVFGYQKFRARCPCLVCFFGFLFLTTCFRRVCLVCLFLRLPYRSLDISAVVEARASYEASEASLGEVPDEFLDPVLCHVMKDPVLLPTSGTILDRCARQAM